MFSLPTSIPSVTTQSFFSSTVVSELRQEIKSKVSQITDLYLQSLEKSTGFPLEQLTKLWNQPRIVQLCCYVPEKGKKPGKPCGLKATNGKFCDKHIPKAVSLAAPLVTVPTTKIVIGTNLYGNREHEETGLIFNPTTQQVIGRQIAAEVRKLTPFDLQQCVRYGFTWDPSAVGEAESMTPQLNETLVADQLE